MEKKDNQELLDKKVRTYLDECYIESIAEEPKSIDKDIIKTIIEDIWEQTKDEIKEKKDQIVATAFRVYKEDSIAFREYGKKNKIKQRDCFRELVKILQKTEGRGKKGKQMTFVTGIRNDFNQREYPKQKVFSIAGNWLGGTGIDSGEIKLEGKKIKISYIDNNTGISREIKVLNAGKWMNALNYEFDLNLNFEEDNLIENRYNISFWINIYRDLNNNKYLIHDFLNLEYCPRTQMTNQYGISKTLEAHRFFYVKNKDELEKQLKKDMYLYLDVNMKKSLSEIIDMKVINPQSIEKELKQYYK